MTEASQPKRACVSLADINKALDATETHVRELRRALNEGKTESIADLDDFEDHAGLGSQHLAAVRDWVQTQPRYRWGIFDESTFSLSEQPADEVQETMEAALSRAATLVAEGASKVTIYHCVRRTDGWYPDPRLECGDHITIDAEHFNHEREGGE